MIDISNLLPTKNLIPPRGSLSSPIAIVGEAPGEEENRAGKPFVGKSGNLLDKCCKKANLPSRDLYLTNVIKEWPGRGNNIKPFFQTNNRGESKFTERGEAYLPILKDELSKFTGNVIIAAGAVALKALCNVDGILKYRGSILESTLLPGKKIIPTIHPASALRQYIQQYFLIHDLRRAVRESRFPEIHRPKRNLITNPRWSQAYEWFNDTRKDWNNRMSIDIEISGQLEMSCIAFSYDPSEAICLPIAQYSEDHELLAMLEVEKIISDPEMYLIGQNFNFDLQFMIKRYQIHPAYRPDPYTIGDTMIGHNVLYPDFPKGLDFLCSIYTDEPYYKADGKEWKNTKDWNKFWEYNCKDAATTLEIWDKVAPALKSGGFWKTYLMDVRKHYPMFFVQTRGMNTKPTAIAETKNKVEISIKEAQAELDQAVKNRFPEMEEVDAIPKMGLKGFLNAGSDKQVKDYFYTKLGISPYKAKGKITVDDTALRRLAKGTASRSGYPEATMIQKVRGLRKFYDTYLEMSFDDDYRFRCTYNPRGTIFGRYSSRDTIFHTGMNQQNLPHEFKHFLLADPGYLLWVLDGEQAEWVATAYIAGEPRMIKVMEDYWAGVGPDPHTATASMITGLPTEIVKLEENYFSDNDLGHTSNPTLIQQAREAIWAKNLGSKEAYKKALFIPTTMTLRQAGKKSNHGFNYGMGPDKFSIQHTIPLSDAKRSHTFYHRGYSGLEKWYQRLQSELRTLENPFGRRVRLLGRWDHSLFNQAYAFKPQSTVADLTIQEGLFRVFEDDVAGDPVVKSSELMFQEHDGIGYQYPLTDLNLMAQFINRIKTYLESPITVEGRTFSIKAEAMCGWSWGNMKKIDVSSVESIEAGAKKFIEENPR